MKKLALLATLIFSVMFPSASYAEWKKVSRNVSGDTYYLDFDRVRKHDGYVYIWTLDDYLKPDKDGDLSEKNYIQCDCKLFRHKILSGSFHKEPMGGGSPQTVTPKNPKWVYPSPDSVNETLLKSVCEHAK